VAQVLIQPELLGHEEVWIGAGSERHMAGISPVDLVRLTRARVGDLSES
jgi:prolyl-tRNA editing enzyme YbaK/EbsC (Cys-tRNA(Pro) deacylase)